METRDGARSVPRFKKEQEPLESSAKPDRGFMLPFGIGVGGPLPRSVQPKTEQLNCNQPGSAEIPVKHRFVVSPSYLSDKRTGRKKRWQRATHLRRQQLTKKAQEFVELERLPDEFRGIKPA